MDIKEKIGRIKSIIENWGSTTSGELALEASPCVNSLAGGDVCELVESFNLDDVDTVVYDRKGNELDYNSYTYEELSEDIIDEIFDIMENYDVDMEKTMERCRD